MQKVIVIGCPGSGKSCFARALHARTGLPLYHLDMLWHRPDRTNVGREAFDAQLSEILAQERWIIDGNYARTLEMRMRACDTVFYFDIPLEDCLAGAASRVGTQREDMPWIETGFDPEFRRWIEEFPQRDAPKIAALLDGLCREKTVVVFKSRGEADRFLSQLND